MAQPELDRSKLPAILASYVYVDGWEIIRSKMAFRDWALDCGAFTARGSPNWTKQRTGMSWIDLKAYTSMAIDYQENDPECVDIFALDVIGDERATLRNTEAMWSDGVRAIPCYHYGEPIAMLDHIAANYPKIALGGMADLPGQAKLKWPEQCFARVWKKHPGLKIHGFAVGSRNGIMALPWHSVDASSWKQGAARYRTFTGFKRGPGPNREKIGHRFAGYRFWAIDLKSEVDAMMRVEAEHRWKFRKHHPITVRFASDWCISMNGSHTKERIFLRAFGKESWADAI